MNSMKLYSTNILFFPLLMITITTYYCVNTSFHQNVSSSTLSKSSFHQKATPSSSNLYSSMYTSNSNPSPTSPSSSFTYLQGIQKNKSFNIDKSHPNAVSYDKKLWSPTHRAIKWNNTKSNLHFINTIQNHFNHSINTNIVDSSTIKPNSKHNSLQSPPSLSSIRHYRSRKNFARSNKSYFSKIKINSHHSNNNENIIKIFNQSTILIPNNISQSQYPYNKSFIKNYTDSRDPIADDNNKPRNSNTFDGSIFNTFKNKKINSKNTNLLKHIFQSSDNSWSPENIKVSSGKKTENIYEQNKKNPYGVDNKEWKGIKNKSKVSHKKVESLNPSATRNSTVKSEKDKQLDGFNKKNLKHFLHDGKKTKEKVKVNAEETILHSKTSPTKPFEKLPLHKSTDDDDSKNYDIYHQPFVHKSQNYFHKSNTVNNKDFFYGESNHMTQHDVEKPATSSVTHLHGDDYLYPQDKANGDNYNYDSYYDEYGFGYEHTKNDNIYETTEEQYPTNSTKVHSNLYDDYDYYYYNPRNEDHFDASSTPNWNTKNRNKEPDVDNITTFLTIVETQHVLGDNCTPGTDFNLGEGVVDRYAQERFRLEAEFAVNRANMLTRIWKYTDSFVLDNEYLLHALVISMVEFDEDIFAAGNCYDGGQYKNYSLFCPYGYRQKNGIILVKDLSLEYKYLSNTSEWFYIARKNAEQVIKEHNQMTLGEHKFRHNETTMSNSVEDEILNVTYEDGKWSKPYFDCGGGNIWMMTYTVPFFGFDKKTHSYFFKGTSGIDIDLRRVDIDQCPLPENATEVNIFAASDKCKFPTTKCVPIKGLGFRRGSYKCQCKDGFYFPNVSSPFKYFNGTMLEEEYQKMLNNEENLYIQKGSFECLKCPPGCDTCIDDRPCVVSLNWFMRTGILILQCAIIFMLPIVGIFTWKYSDVKVVRAASPVLLRFIVLGAFLIYCTILVMYPTPSIVTCTLKIWLREIGFSLAYGALMLKTWRISVIFRVRSAKAIKITDLDLLKRLGIIVAIFTALLVIRTLVAPPVVVIRFTADDLKARLCTSDWWDHSFTIMELSFLVWGIRLCIVVRKAPSEFNESKFISLAIYNEFLLSLFLNISMLFLQSPANPDLLYIIFFGHVQLTMTLLLCLIFGSKAYMVLRGQGKGGVDENRAPTSKFISSKGRHGKQLSGQNSTGYHSSTASTMGQDSIQHQLSEDIQEEFRRLYYQLEELKERNMRQGNRHLVAKISAMQEAADAILCTKTVTVQQAILKTGSSTSLPPKNSNTSFNKNADSGKINDNKGKDNDGNNSLRVPCALESMRFNKSDQEASFSGGGIVNPNTGVSIKKVSISECTSNIQDLESIKETDKKVVSIEDKGSALKGCNSNRKDTENVAAVDTPPLLPSSELSSAQPQSVHQLTKDELDSNVKQQTNREKIKKECKNEIGVPSNKGEMEHDGYSDDIGGEQNDAQISQEALYDPSSYEDIEMIDADDGDHKSWNDYCTTSSETSISTKGLEQGTLTSECIPMRRLKASCSKDVIESIDDSVKVPVEKLSQEKSIKVSPSASSINMTEKETEQFDSNNERKLKNIKSSEDRNETEKLKSSANSPSLDIAEEKGNFSGAQSTVEKNQKKTSSPAKLVLDLDDKSRFTEEITV